MRELEKGMLLVILRSQLDITNAILKRATESKYFDSVDMINTYGIELAKKKEIQRQIEMLEQEK